jgi:hypothetical protein
MSEWWTYSPSDFLMFSARSYWRLTELTNRDMWPAQLVALVVGIVVLGCVARADARAQRIAYLLLGAGWAWVGWAYHLQRYADINTGAPYFAGAFALQALLLWLCALRPRMVATSRLRRRGGLLLAGAGVLAYPLLALVDGHGWSRAEVFAIVPDPTAVATLGALLALRAHWLAWIVPLAWCAASSTTLVELRVWHAWLPLGLAALAVAAGLAALCRERALSSTAGAPT